MKQYRLIFFLVTFLTCSGAFFLWIHTIQGTPATPPTDRERQQKYITQFKEIPFHFDSLKTGDLVVRAGRSFFSDELRRYNLKDDTYSHCGWVTRDDDGKIYILHAIGGSDNKDNLLRKDHPANFFHPNSITAFAIYRYDLNSSEITIGDSIARSYYDRGTEFDMDFDLYDDNKIYCAEYIYRILAGATNNEKYISLSQRNDKIYVAVDDLYLTQNCKKIFDYEYNEKFH